MTTTSSTLSVLLAACEAEPSVALFSAIADECLANGDGAAFCGVGVDGEKCKVADSVGCQTGVVGYGTPSRHPRKSASD